MTTSCTSSPCRCHARSTPSRRNPIRSSARCERPLRVFAHAVSRSKPSRSNASAAIIALASKFAPEPHQRCPSQEPTVARRSRRASSLSPVTPIGPCVGIDDQEVQQLARLAPRRQRRDVRLGLLQRSCTAPRRRSA